MRLRARTDHNHVDVARTLRQCGAQVLDLSRVGGGCPDLLVSCSGGARWTFVEVKTARGKLTDQQVQFAIDHSDRRRGAHAMSASNPRVLTEAPHIHIHYLMADTEADAHGFGRAELCCHACGSALILTYPWPSPDNSLKPYRDGFVAMHERCRGPQFTALCPMDRTFTAHRDLRTAEPTP